MASSGNPFRNMRQSSSCGSGYDASTSSITGTGISFGMPSLSLADQVLVNELNRVLSLGSRPAEETTNPTRSRDTNADPSESRSNTACASASKAKTDTQATDSKGDAASKMRIIDYGERFDREDTQRTFVQQEDGSWVEQLSAEARIDRKRGSDVIYPESSSEDLHFDSELKSTGLSHDRRFRWNEDGTVSVINTAQDQ
ncbi:uncharacterized protein I303_105277 [Kwoniella dejecticola CBS 10117]|uniref:Uncharacterized protein n=1 Tax=Kwoniella dejecticola CBS 10117 TaxID=1296121 RepID=A0A1A6A2X8_9TREE|nr:uncharacterized protein I303_05275 [Kwoniella dejecticola CBS 10117]OBR84417.1 hypothetical protein I303_05275 [Kwoniella dejecticola CBS 10117]